MPAVVATAITVIQGLIKYSPDIIKAVQQGKALIEALFGAKVISAEQQDQLNAQVNAFLEGFKAGQTPPAWKVEPDPVSAGTVQDLGIVTGTTETASDVVPSEFVNTPRIIAKITNYGDGSLMICNAAGNCWAITDTSKLIKKDYPSMSGAIWTIGTLRFWVPDSVKA